MDLKTLQTPLHAAHVRQGGRMVPFAGWDMPIQYTGILAEARAVRNVVGIFDVSHMGRFILKGPQAQALLDWVHTADIGENMAIGRARYGLICNQAGGIIDDGIIYKLDAEEFMLVANAGNSSIVLAWLEHWKEQEFPEVTIDNQTQQLSMLALQGPETIRLLTQISTFDPGNVRPFHSSPILIKGQEVLVARTGYTGEDGVELMPQTKDTEWLWSMLLENDVIPCGLGARDVLRLEAGLPLHGSDISVEVTPFEAGLERFVKSKRSYCGMEAIQERLSSENQMRMIGFELIEKGPIPRTHSTIVNDNIPVGEVSSGGYSPTLDRNIGLGYVPIRLASPGSEIQIDIRGKIAKAMIVSLPFYNRRRQP